MKNNSKAIIFLLMTIAVLLNYKISYAYKNIDLFQEVLSETKGQVVEYGLKTRFKSKINGQELVNYFVNEINANISTKVKSYRGKNSYIINFKDINSEGFIEVIDDEVIVQIIKKDETNNLESLRENIERIISPISENKNTYYKYLKAQLPNSDLLSLNKEILELLKSKGADNIHSVEISNGYSNSLYTKIYKPKNNNGELMDLNFALCNYSSGNYIIIGTPEIFITY
ncbi:MAG: hypothetical protein VB130_04440 [Clostridium sp.]|nr:hypothetical protein [Clostridium sp.]